MSSNLKKSIPSRRLNSPSRGQRVTALVARSKTKAVSATERESTAAASGTLHRRHQGSVASKALATGIQNQIGRLAGDNRDDTTLLRTTTTQSTVPLTSPSAVLNVVSDVTDEEFARASNLLNASVNMSVGSGADGEENTMAALRRTNSILTAVATLHIAQQRKLIELAAHERAIQCAPLSKLVTSQAASEEEAERLAERIVDIAARTEHPFAGSKPRPSTRALAVGTGLIADGEVDGGSGSGNPLWWELSARDISVQSNQLAQLYRRIHTLELRCQLVERQNTTLKDENARLGTQLGTCSRALQQALQLLESNEVSSPVVNSKFDVLSEGSKWHPATENVATLAGVANNSSEDAVRYYDSAAGVEAGGRDEVTQPHDAANGDKQQAPLHPQAREGNTNAEFIDL